MKFSHSIQFNAVPEWSSKYIAYTSLKKLIYNLQRESLRKRAEDTEATQLYTNEPFESNDTKSVFLSALDSELKKIDTFYKQQEKDIFSDIDELIKDTELLDKTVAFSDDRRPLLRSIESRKSDRNATLRTRTNSLEADNGDERCLYDIDHESCLNHEHEFRPEPDVLTSKMNSSKAAFSRQRSQGDLLLKSAASRDYLENVHTPHDYVLSESRILIRKRIIGHYTTLSELKSYIELNQTGFTKALKKFDKSLETSIKDKYLSSLPKKSYVFKPSTMTQVEKYLDSLVSLYAKICNHSDDLESARSELSIHLREHVVWERNTVWRDMIGLERKSQALNQSATILSGEEKSPTARKPLQSNIKTSTVIKLFCACAIFMILLVVSPFEEVEQKNCFALLVLASTLWATEAMPLFVTSLLIPLLIVILGVLKNKDGSRMTSKDSSTFILSTMWNSVILLLLGGFTIAASLTKFHIAKLISTWILSNAGTNPSVVLFTIMSIALFASMWVSNVAAPVLCFSLIQPLLRTLPKGSRFKKALIIGIALASNIGGMASPIASPQNMIAIGSMKPAPSWGQWFVIAIPVCVLSLISIWCFLLISFKCNSQNTQLIAIRTIDEKFSGVQWYIVLVSGATIILWCMSSSLEGLFGEMGMIALIPLILFFGPGLLTTEDFNNYPWNIIVLAMGGTALGKAVASSGLLSTIAVSIQKEVEGFSLFGVTLTFGLLILTVATFVSHTVAALIIIPLVEEIGNKLDDPHPRILVMASALLCSAAMGLPTSGFPNVTAICMTDEFGKPYLTVSTFITRGVPCSVLAYVIIVTVGFSTMKIIAF